MGDMAASMPSPVLATPHTPSALGGNFSAPIDDGGGSASTASARPRAPAPPAPPAGVRAEIKRDAAGVSEKLRRHAGNVPVLPQTKQCPQCPAKFTRSTHLNRHLKTHSAERLHKCEACGSEFTRTDLLSRHKKTCNGVSRSRRKSCVPCAESKIKCDLAYPCEKCGQRGKTCVLPSSSAGRTAASRQHHAHAHPLAPVDSHGSSMDGGGEGGSPHLVLPDDPAADGTRASHSPPLPGGTAGAGPSGAVHPAHGEWRHAYGSQYGASSTADSTTDDYSTALSYQSNGAQGGSGTPSLSAMYNAEVFSGLFSGIFTPPPSAPSAPSAGAGYISTGMPGALPPPSVVPPASAAAQQQQQQQQQQGPAPLGELVLDFGEYVAQAHHPHPHPGLVSPYGSVGPAPSQQLAGVPMRLSPPLFGDGAYAEYAVGVQAPPTALELENYMALFFSTFIPQMPIVHAPTFRAEGKPEFLLAAMRACGALYVRTPRAATFIVDTLADARETVNREFVRTIPTLQEQSFLFLAVALLQAVGLFHQRAETRASHSIFHGMLVQMIRRYGFINHNAAWTAPDVGRLTDPVAIEAAWLDWAAHESAKRAILLSFVHDCCHVIYFGIPASFSTSEFLLNLPADDAVWRAANSAEWYYALQQPSAYGWPEYRLLGYPMQKAFLAISDARKLAALTGTCKLNPYALWVLIHAILRNLYALVPSAGDPNRMYTDWKRRMREPTAASHPHAGVVRDADADASQEVLKVQYVLHNWLAAWLQCPETPDDGTDAGADTPFMADALPFYWLGQISLLALQEAIAPFSAHGMPDVDARFRLVKHWLRHVRNFMRAGAHAGSQSTLLWNEMMKIRLQGENEADSDGLLGFFPDIDYQPAPGVRPPPGYQAPM